MRPIFLIFLFPILGFAQADTILDPFENIDCVPYDTTVVPYESLDVQPQFPGGEAEMMMFISQNVVYPEDLTERGHYQSLFYMKFIIEVDGTLSNKGCFNCHEPEFKEMVMFLLDKMPRWEAGELNGKKVRTEFTLPLQVCLR